MIKRLFSTAALALVLAHGLAPALAEPVTSARVNTLPTAEQAAWQKYLGRSQAAARADQAALDAEVAKSGMKTARQAPNGGNFKLSAKPGSPYYAGAEAKQLADIILSYQTPSGGWSKHTGYSVGPRQSGMQWTSQNAPGQPPHYLATFDNRSTTDQMNFLAYVAHATGREDCKAAVIKGLDYILAAQYPNGGWPQTYPLEGGYHDDITLNDDAMTHVLEMLQSIQDSDPNFTFIDAARREKAAAALAAGIHCLLALQVEVNGKKTVWCAQYDPITLQPSAARKMEPVSLSGLESARALAFLMTVKQPSPELVTAIESGLAWFQAATVKGMKKSNVTGKTTYEPDPSSTEVYWARFYDLKTGKPVFPGRNGILYPTFEAMVAAGNHVGYDYYTTIPNSIVNTGQKKWRKMLAKTADKTKVVTSQ